MILCCRGGGRRTFLGLPVGAGGIGGDRTNTASCLRGENRSSAGSTVNLSPSFLRTLAHQAFSDTSFISTSARASPRAGGAAVVVARLPGGLAGPPSAPARVGAGIAAGVVAANGPADGGADSGAVAHPFRPTRPPRSTTRICARDMNPKEYRGWRRRGSPTWQPYVATGAKAMTL